MSRRRQRSLSWWCCGVLLAFLTSGLHAQSLPSEVDVELRRAAVPSSAVGVLVQEVGAVAPLVSFNAQAALNPASTMKLLTTFAALELLGPAYTWKTVLASSAPAADVLNGDLVLKGSGDPKLVLESFWLLLRQLRQRGVREIRGDLVLDRSVFDLAPFDPARFDADPLRPYNVGPDGLLVNFKSVIFRFVPDVERRIALVISEPRGASAPSVPRLVEGPCGDWRGGLRADFSNPARPVFQGVYPRSCGERNWPVSLLAPNQYLETLFRQMWSEAGGVLRGVVREGLMPADASVLAERQSPSLAEVVRDINKFSNNVMARQLYLSLPVELERQPGSVERAERLVRAWLDRRGLAMPELVIENGAGLSRLERISAGNMGRLLLAAFASPVMPEFVASLPLAGSDGTMRRRLNGRSISGRAHIKTGTLTDVRALAGYVLAASGKRYAVVALVNHANAAGTQAALDALLQWVFERG
jgi:D-alanyl-D-alanine carboxypeptidase/D-alanyl-D-alanine-endopeptidase (penicillin-binding protein 4)